MSTALVGILAGLTLLLAAPRSARLVMPPSTIRSLSPWIQIFACTAGVYLFVVLDVSILLIGLLLGVSTAVVRALRRRRARAVAARRRTLVLAACEGLASDLAAGIAPQQALLAMAEDWPELAPVADAGTVGADVAVAFRSLAALPGAEMLRVAAAAWSVAHRSGAGLADAVGLAADTLRVERATARTVATEMAAALATARLLALLPIGILIIGRGAGGDPLGFLFRSTGGQICLTLGLALAWTGSIWLERISDQVSHP